MVESILIVAAIAVGVALVAAMTAFWGDYNRQTDILLNDPAYREVVVQVVGLEKELTEPVAEYDPETAKSVSIGVDELELAMRSVSAAEYAYLGDRTRLQAGIADRLRNAIADGRLGPAGEAGGTQPSGVQPTGVQPTGAQARSTPDEPVSERDLTIEEEAAIFGKSDEDVELARTFSIDEKDDAEPAESAMDERLDGEAENDEPDAATASDGGGRGGEPRGAGFAGRPGGAPGGFDLQQLLQGSGDVTTEFPVDWVAAVQATEQVFPAYGVDVARGSLFTDDDVRTGNLVMVLGASLAQTLFPDQDPVGQRAVFGIRTFTIIGVLEPSEIRDTETGLSLNDVAFIPNSEAQISFGGRTIELQGASQTLRFAVADSSEIDLAVSQIESFFEAEYGPGVVSINARIEEAAQERDQIGRVLVVVLFLATAALFIASINLFNLMLMRVIKRTKDVGINRAIGASRGSVFRSFLNESALLSLMGTVVGLAASPIVYRLLTTSLVVTTQSLASQRGLGASGSTWLLLVAGAAVAAGISLIFGVWPARQASRIDASLAIRTE